MPTYRVLVIGGKGQGKTTVCECLNTNMSVP